MVLTKKDIGKKYGFKPNSRVRFKIIKVGSTRIKKLGRSVTVLDLKSKRKFVTSERYYTPRFKRAFLK